MIILLFHLLSTFSLAAGDPYDIGALRELKEHGIEGPGGEKESGSAEGGRSSAPKKFIRCQVDEKGNMTPVKGYFEPKEDTIESILVERTSEKNRWTPVPTLPAYPGYQCLPVFFDKNDGYVGPVCRDDKTTFDTKVPAEICNMDKSPHDVFVILRSPENIQLRIAIPCLDDPGIDLPVCVETKLGENGELLANDTRIPDWASQVFGDAASKKIMLAYDKGKSALNNQSLQEMGEALSLAAQGIQHAKSHLIDNALNALGVLSPIPAKACKTAALDRCT